jgi:hypothetical protein
MSLYVDEAMAKPVKRHIGVWDDNPRFLGMFASYDVPPGAVNPPMIGVGDHLVTCRGCAESKGEVHPALHAIFMYLHVQGRIYTVSWPTWAEF